MTPHNLPEDVLNMLKKHTESFVLVSFNRDGLPIVNVCAPSIKDFLALERLVIEYGAQGLPLPEEIGEFGESEEDDDEDAGFGGDSWKHQK